MRYDPKIGDLMALEAISVEIEESNGRTTGEFVKYDEKGATTYSTTYYLVTVQVTFTN